MTLLSACEFSENRRKEGYRPTLLTGAKEIKFNACAAKLLILESKERFVKVCTQRHGLHHLQSSFIFQCCVGFGAGLDGCGKSRLHGDSIPGPSSP
jgi:hypothetical protein